jgi:hypothetical protein
LLDGGDAVVDDGGVVEEAMTAIGLIVVAAVDDAWGEFADVI